MERLEKNVHLTEEDFFRLAVPPAGEPEALPSHLLACAECAKNLQTWKTAVSDLAEEDEAVLARRSPERWEALEDATLAAIRRSGSPGSQRRRQVWALGLAASLLLAVILIGRGPAGQEPAVALQEASELAAEDRADDALLRDIGVLARGEEPGDLWNTLAPLPASEGVAEVEENL